MGASKRQDSLARSHSDGASQISSVLQRGPVPPTKGRAEFSRVLLADTTRVSLMLAPRGRGSFAGQANEVFSAARTIVEQQPFPMVLSSQTVFLQNAADQVACDELLARFYGPNRPVTSYVLQAPCCGAALAVEAWAVRSDTVQLQRFGSQAVLLDYGGLQWLHVGGVRPRPGNGLVYEQTLEALDQMRRILVDAGFDFSQVTRTWFYLGSITGLENESERYRELNRARTDFYRDIGFFASTLKPGAPRGSYPASTGIGMSGEGLVLACTAFRAGRDQEAMVLPLENPRQVPAYAYHPKYSPQSPKFSRALALLRPAYVVTWISGTASIVNSESRHQGDITKQTEQTLDNIERLIDEENFASRGAAGAGATLQDLAKVRIYIKRHEDYAKCKAVCEKRFGTVPAIYAVADVCRPELLVEIEAIAFRPRSGPRTKPIPAA